MGVIRIKNCARCNSLFDCYCESDRECWCAAYSLSTQTLEKLNSTFQGCLCPSCLKEFAEKDAKFVKK